MLDGLINDEAFTAWVEQFLVPTLRPGDTVMLDNLSSHKGEKVHERIKSAGADLIFLPPYSPDFNPIEKAFAKLKALLRKATERTDDALWNTIGHIVACSARANVRTMSPPADTMQIEGNPP